MIRFLKIIYMAHTTIGFLHYEQIGKSKNKNPPKKKKLFGFIKKVGLSPSRNAFLLLIKLNVFKLAEKLYKAIKKNEPALKRKWESLGGNYTKLKNTVIKRIQKRIQKGKMVAGTNHDYIGAVPLSAAIATALPILKALADFVGKMKAGKSQQNQEEENQED